AERILRPVVPEEDAHPPRLRLRSMFSTGVMRGPWPDGPLARVDEEFQNVVLESSSIHHLYKVRPAIAREVILAALIEEPREECWGSSPTPEREFGLTDRRWRAPL